LGDGSGLKQHGSGRYAPYTLLLAQYSLLILQNYDTNRKSRGDSITLTSSGQFDLMNAYWGGSEVTWIIIASNRSSKLVCPPLSPLFQAAFPAFNRDEMTLYWCDVVDFSNVDSWQEYLQKVFVTLDWPYMTGNCSTKIFTNMNIPGQTLTAKEIRARSAMSLRHQRGVLPD